MSDKSFVCCLCGNTFTGWGNNPWPLNTQEDARCCDDCNTLVMKERIEMAYMNRQRNNNNGN